MVGTTATWFLLGCALGLRFRVQVLVPAVTFVMLVAAVVGIARGDQYWSVVVAMILFGTAVQFGYLAGIITHDGIASVRSRRRKMVTKQKLGVSQRPENCACVVSGEGAHAPTARL
jgi:hypothetical protein